MPAKDALTVSLTPELSAFIHAQVASGRYHTASEVVRAGLRLLTRSDPVSRVPGLEELTEWQRHPARR